MTFQPARVLAKAYSDWLIAWPKVAKKWSHLYKSSPKSAMCEASFWKILRDCGVEVHPSEDFNGTRPSTDFTCRKNGEKFYVEATCMDNDAVTRATSLPDELLTPDVVYTHDTLSRKIVNEVKNKVRQCANLDAPALVAVGTFHVEASTVSLLDEFLLEFLLLGEPDIKMLPRGARRESVLSLFNASSGNMPARICVSGVIVAGLAYSPPHVRGLLNPSPALPFNAELLDCIKFGRLQHKKGDGEPLVEWGK